MRREKDNHKDNWGSNPLGSPGEAEHSQRFTRDISLPAAHHEYVFTVQCSDVYPSVSQKKQELHYI
jgi:hypothetical protein